MRLFWGSFVMPHFKPQRFKCKNNENLVKKVKIIKREFYSLSAVKPHTFRCVVIHSSDNDLEVFCLIPDSSK